MEKKKKFMTQQELLQILRQDMKGYPRFSYGDEVRTFWGDIGFVMGSKVKAGYQWVLLTSGYPILCEEHEITPV